MYDSTKKLLSRIVKAYNDKVEEALKTGCYDKMMPPAKTDQAAMLDMIVYEFAFEHCQEVIFEE